METDSSILAWKIPWTEEPGRLQSIGLQRVGHNLACMHIPLYLLYILHIYETSPHSTVGKESACNAGHLGLIPGLGRSPVEGNGNPLQCSCLENPRDREWQATVHGVTRVRHDLATKPPRLYIYLHCNCICKKF